jgi:DNA-binding NarL/FixJ family response regulator
VEEPRIVAALEAGVRGYVEKNRAAEDLIPAIYAVAEGRVYRSPRFDYLCSTRAGSEDVTPGPLSGARPHRHAPGSVPQSEMP